MNRRQQGAGPRRAVLRASAWACAAALLAACGGGVDAKLTADAASRGLDTIEQASNDIAAATGIRVGQVPRPTGVCVADQQSLTTVLATAAARSELTDAEAVAFDELVAAVRACGGAVDERLLATFTAG